ncbi:MAG: hypothetical protein HC888_05105 [Candidatus Competibacteraceae bacterium]|nr:hypothetical protein [Candidatus Competibacteraceae bacterium]
MPWLAKDDKGVYVVRWKDGKRVRSKSTRTTRRRDAERARDVQEKKLRNKALGIEEDVPDIALAEAWEIYERWAVMHRDGKTVSANRGAWNHFTAFAGKRRVLNVAEVTPGLLWKYQEACLPANVDQVKLERARRGWNTRLRKMRSVWKRLQRIELDTGPIINPQFNPWAKVDFFQKKQAGTPSHRHLSVDELAGLFKLAKETQHDLWIAANLGFYLGARHSEILNLKWGDVVFGTAGAAGKARLWGKQGKERWVDVCSALESILRPMRGLPERYVCYPTQMPGKSQYRADLRHFWYAVVDELKLCRLDGSRMHIP